MSLIPDELKTQYFPCPNCGQTLTDEASVCRFCSFEIPDEVRSDQIQQEAKRNKNERLKGHKNMMAIGGAFFIAGVGMVALPFVDIFLGERSINASCCTPLVLMIGIVAFIKGYLGLRNEKREF